jgi:hypothetical protein
VVVKVREDKTLGRLATAEHVAVGGEEAFGGCRPGPPGGEVRLEIEMSVALCQRLEIGPKEALARVEGEEVGSRGLLREREGEVAGLRDRGGTGGLKNLAGEGDEVESREVGGEEEAKVKIVGNVKEGTKGQGEKAPGLRAAAQGEELLARDLSRPGRGGGCGGGRAGAGR